jgi:protein-disulfide isomerase
MWGDFQCPACRAFVLGVERQLDQTLVADGVAKVVWRDMAFLGDESVWAAQAADCAADQGQFWEYHDKLYAEQAGENRGTFQKENLKRFAADIGLDQETFNVCLDTGQHAGDVQREITIGRTRGVNATPTLFVNGQKVAGVPSFEQLRQLVLAAAATASPAATDEAQ